MPAWTPANLAVLPAVWFSAQRSTVTQSGGSVSAIQNLGSLAGSLTESYVPNEPIYSASGWDGSRPSIMFNHATLSLSWSYSGNRLAIFGATETSAGDGGRIVNLRTDNFEGYADITVTQVARRNSTQFQSARDYVDTPFNVGDAKHIFGAVHGASGASLRADGGTAVTNSQVGSFGFTQLFIGAEFGGEYGTNYVTAKIPEVIILTYEPTSGEREQIEGYLAWEWGIQALLPSGHPYRNAAPQTGGGGTTTNQTVSVTSAGAVAIRRMVGKRVAVVSSGLVSVLRVRSLRRTVAVASTGAVTVLRRLSLSRVVSIASSAAVGVRKAISKQVSVASASTVLVNAITAGAAIVYQTVAVIASSSVAVRRSIGKRVAVSATGAVSLRKSIAKTIAVAANSTIQVAKGLAVRITVAAASAASVTAGRLYRQAVNVLGSSSVTAMASMVMFTFGQRVVRLLPMMRLAATDRQNRAAAVDMENRTVAVLSDGNNVAAPED